jgi:hypothetical protein
MMRRKIWLPIIVALILMGVIQLSCGQLDGGTPSTISTTVLPTSDEPQRGCGGEVESQAMDSTGLVQIITVRPTVNNITIALE